MRFMIIVKADANTEAGVMPEDDGLLAEMASYHEALAQAGVLLDAAGLQPSAKGWRVQYDGPRRTVTDGPFAEAKELVAGYTLIQVRSREEALEWARRFPNPAVDGGRAAIEVRQLFELEDFEPGEAVERFRDIEARQTPKGTSMIKTILLLVLAAIALLLIYAATRPDSFRVQRTAVIKAPAPKIFALINDLKAFNNWNPYEKKDPGIKGSYSGAASGVGAAYAWEGQKVGSGRMEIIAAQAPNQVTMKLDFEKPFKAQNTAEFTLQAQGDNLTIVTWAMHGPSPYLSKLMGVVINMDTMIGSDFEAGLANLKVLTEGR